MEVLTWLYKKSLFMAASRAETSTETAEVTACEFRLAWPAFGERMPKMLGRCSHDLETVLAKDGKGAWNFRPHGPPQDFYTDERWVPVCWAESEHQRSVGLWDFGSPWLLMDRPKAWRADIHDVPLSGLGQLWVQKSGQRLVLM